MTRMLTPVGSMTRDVPAGVARRVRFGGTLGWGGWMTFGFSMIFFWTFAFQADFSAWTSFHGELKEATARVTSVQRTSATVGGGKGRSGTPVYKFQYTFDTPDERTFGGTAYTTGQKFTAGKEATVEYPAGRPEMSRLKGARRAMWPAPMALLGLAPLVGVAIIVVALKKGNENVRILREGVVTEGRLVKKERTNTKVNNRTVYKFTYGFQDHRGRTHQVVTRTHKTEDVGDEATETVVYDPNDPTKACVADALPGGVKFDDRGEIVSGGLGLGGWAFAGLVLGVHAVVAIVMFGR